jgi:hypothetical protein
LACSRCARSRAPPARPTSQSTKSTRASTPWRSSDRGHRGGAADPARNSKPARLRGVVKKAPVWTCASWIGRQRQSERRVDLAKRSCITRRSADVLGRSPVRYAHRSLWRPQLNAGTLGWTRSQRAPLHQALVGLHPGYEDRSRSSCDWAHYQSDTALRGRWSVAEGATFRCLSRFLGSRRGHPAACWSLSWTGLERGRNEGCSRLGCGLGARLPTPGPDERDRRDQAAKDSWRDP